MSSDQFEVNQAIQSARRALQHGESRAARRWAEHALSLSPHSEEAWLVLGSVASPRASLAYFEEALRISPRSQLARQGLAWAQKRWKARQSGTSHLSGPMPRQVASSENALAKRRTSFPVLLLTLACLLAAWTAWPGNSAYALSLLGGDNAGTDSPPASWSQMDLVRPTFTATATLIPTSTAVPTATPTLVSTATPLPTETPTSIPLPTDTPFPAPIMAGNSYVVQPGDTLFSIAQRAGLDQSALAAANNIADGRTIYAGQVLSIPDGAVVAELPSAPSYPAGEKRILVDISEQHLYAYEGDTLVFSFVASTGMNNATRVGTFRVQDKIPNAYGATWNIWMPNWLGIYYAGSLENGIHALPILPNGSRLWAGYLGSPISYGCVVLGVQESQMLYEWADVGTIVQIQR